MRQTCVLATALAILPLIAPWANGDEPDDKPITIPLDQIWAYEMPGTKDIRGLEPDKFGALFGLILGFGGRADCAC